MIILIFGIIVPNFHVGRLVIKKQYSVCSSRFSDSQAARYVKIFFYPLVHIQTTWCVFNIFTFSTQKFFRCGNESLFTFSGFSHSR